MNARQKTGNIKTDRTPLFIGMANKQAFLAWLRLRGVLYSNNSSLLKLGYFVLCFMDDGYLVAYTPTPAIYRDTFVGQITSLFVVYDDPVCVYEKLERYHLMLFNRTIKTL
jgi:hypothetical protein